MEDTQCRPPHIAMRCQPHAPCQSGIRVWIPACMHGSARACEVHDWQTFTIPLTWLFYCADSNLHCDQTDGLGCGNWLAHLIQGPGSRAEEIERVQIVKVEEANDLDILVSAALPA